MSCYFKIHIPGGGYISIPSSVNTLDTDEALQAKIDDFYKSPKSFFEDLKKLYKSRVSKDFTSLEKTFSEKYPVEYEKFLDLASYIAGPLDNVHEETIKKIIRNSSADTLVDDVNQSILEEITQESLEDAIKKWAYEDLPTGQDQEELFPRSLKEFLAIVNRAKVTPKYFQQLPFMDVVAKTSLKEEISKISNTIVQYRDNYNLDPSIQIQIHDFLSSVDNIETRHEKFLFGTSTTGTVNDTLVLPKTEDSKGFIFYNKGNDLSLFLGVFKYVSANANWNKENTNKLKEILVDWNKTNESKLNLENFSPEEFFIGKFDSEGNFQEASLHTFINGYSVKHINALIDLISETGEIAKTTKFKETSRRIFKSINPEKYGKGIFSTEIIAANEYDAQSIKNRKARIRMIAAQYGAYNVPGEREHHYKFNEEVNTLGPTAVEKAFTMLKDKIELGKDIIKIPGINKNYDRFVIVTKIKPEKKGIEILGVVLEDGVPEERPFFIKAEQKEGTLSMNITYRKFVTEKVNYIAPNPPKLENAHIIKSQDNLPLSPELVSDYLEVGSFIKYLTSDNRVVTGVVKGVLPGRISLVGVNYLINYNKLIEFNTTKLTEDDLKDWDDADIKKNPKVSLSGISAQVLATKNDIVKHNDKGTIRINKVLHSTKDFVYILVSTLDNFYVEKINRQNILDALVNIDKITINDINEAGANITNILGDKSIRANDYSYSENIDEAQDGDIIVKIGSIPSENVYYKLIDKTNWKVIERTGLTSSDYSVTVLSPNNVNGFLTKRDISNPYASDIDRVNNAKIYTSKEEEKNKVAYMIPENMNLNDAILFDSLHFNIGEVIDEEYIEAYKQKGLKDVTDQAMTFISRKLGKAIKSVHFSTNKDNIREKYVDELFRINHFDSLAEADKIAGLQVGAYVRFGTTNLGKKLFRISEDYGDYMILEYSILNHYGAIKTIRVKKSKLEIVQNISAYYLIKGNSKIQSLVKKVKEKNKFDTRTKEDVREAFIHSAQTILDSVNAGVRVELVSAKDGNFKSINGRKEKAKIQNGNILINKDDSSELNVVHEFLHVFLIGLKYSSPENSKKYQDLLTDFWKNTPEIATNEFKSFDEIEEAFVEKLSNILVGKEELEFDSMVNIENAIVSSIEALGLDITNLPSYDLLTVLNTDLKDLINFSGKSRNYTNLLLFEANFRQWVSNNLDNGNLQIKCI